ncbi:MAG: enoyl-CoA hydratase/isomerase family protein [Burkholderiales bacterium]|nr:enoyl-CoA hydratase/isomerase family protein [Burkholderiales bacterium]
MAQDILIAAESGGIAVVTLNRPSKRNAVSLGMWRQLRDIFSELDARPDIRVIILTGAGGHFCAGADISEFSTVRADAESGRRYEDACEAATLALRDCSKPTMAAISGYAMGGGCALALACDLRVGDSTTRMGIPAARLGIVYGPLDCALLYRQVGLANAKRVLFSGVDFGCDECAAMGLLDMVAPESAQAAAHILASDIEANAPLSLAGSKLILECLAAGSVAARGAEISAIIDRAMNSADYREGARAFLEKRKPAFAGR